MNEGGGSLIRRRVIARGRVQGVFFRASVERLARERGLSGSVRNREDGSLEAIFEGPREAVEGMISYCADGPRGARVSHLEVTEEDPQGIAGFDVG